MVSEHVGILLAGLVMSWGIYHIHFQDASRAPGRHGTINIGLRLQPAPGQRHVLISGGAGYPGAHVALALLDRGHAVTVLDDLSAGSAVAPFQLVRAAPSAFRFVAGDAGDAGALRALLASLTPPVDAVVHFGGGDSDDARGGGCAAAPLECLQRSSSSSLSVLGALNATGVQLLLLSSSYSVYGDPCSHTPPEATPLHPDSVAGQAQLLAELAVAAYAAAAAAHGFRAVILRHGTVFGSDPSGRLEDPSGQGAWQRSQLLDSCLAAAYAARAARGEASTGVAAAAAAAEAAAMAAAAGEPAATQLRGDSGGGSGGGGGSSAARLGAPDGDWRLDASNGSQCLGKFVHVSDLAAAFVVALEHEGGPSTPEVFNIGPGRPVTRSELWHACARTGADARSLLALLAEDGGGGGKGGGVAVGADGGGGGGSGAESGNGSASSGAGGGDDGSSGGGSGADAEAAAAGAQLGWAPLYADAEVRLRHAWRWWQSWGA